MAKQSGIHQLKGKIRGMSYYRQKGVEDGLARSINQGLSKRVKEDAAYANTRLNAAEFGYAGSFAGAAIRGISDRQRSMMKDFATGDFAKKVVEIIKSDTDNSWGSRQLVEPGYQEVLMSALNTYAKVEFSSNVGGVWDVDFASGQVTPNAELPSGWGSLLAAKGATGAVVKMFAYKVELEEIGENTFKGFSTVQLIAEDDVTIGEAATFVTPTTISSTFIPGSEKNHLTGVLVVVLPYQEVNTKKYTRQELCTYQIVPFSSIEV
jgi:hypothetical protein